MDLKLYTYWRSSAAYRVRIALELKGVDYTLEAINIAPGVLEHRGDAYRSVNPQMRIPSLLVDGAVLTQSMAILEWIEETFRSPPLLPTDPVQRAQCRSFAQTIASDIHPVQNMSVLAELRSEYAADDAGVRPLQRSASGRSSRMLAGSRWRWMPFRVLLRSMRRHGRCRSSSALRQRPSRTRLHPSSTCPVSAHSGRHSVRTFR